MDTLELTRTTTILSIALITILGLLTLSLYKNINIRTKDVNLLRQKLDDAEKNLKKFTFIEIDSHIKIAIRQYLSFFSNFIYESKKIYIKLHIEDEENGLKIAFELPGDVSKELVQSWFDEYLSYLNTKNYGDFDIKTVNGVSAEEVDVLILKLKGQIQNFNRQIDILKLEKSYIKDENEYLKDLIKLISSRSQNLFISNTSKDSIVKKQNNYSNQSQFIGGTFKNSQINISNVDDKLLDIINQFATNVKEKEVLINSYKTLKSDESTESEKKKSGSILRKFLETSATEAAKEIIQFAAEKSLNWLKYIGLL